MQQNTGVYPIPQEMTLSGDHVCLASAAIVVAPDDAAARFAGELLGRWVAEEFLVNLPIVESVPLGATPIIIVSDAGALRLDVPAQAEGYTISIGPDGVVLAGRDRQGTLYAVATLIQLVARRDKDDGNVSLSIPAGTIRDWPYRPIRYVHVYVPGRRHIPFFKRYVRDFLLRHKFNGMILEVGGGVRLTRRPEIATGWKRTAVELYAHGEQVPITGESSPLGPDKRFQDSTHHGIGDDGFIEPDELRECVAFARAHGQEVVPEIQALSHVYYLACAHREIAEVPDALFPDAYCPSNERTYEILFDVMDEYVQIMDSRTVHIGHDEWRAGGICPKCRTQHPGDLLARDVIRIYEHLKSRGVQNVWMWGDHFASGHNETGHSHGKGGKVWYDYPSTTRAWEKVRAACPDLVLTNWSWSLKRSDRPDDVWNRGRTWDVQGECDQELHEKGFKFLYGNFNGPLFERWPERSAKYDVLGGEVSSWCTMEEFQIGKMHVPMALASINLLWSNHYPPRDDAARQVIRLLPDVSQRLKAALPPRIRLVPERQATVDLSPHFNAPLKSDRWDLSGLRRGALDVNGSQYRLGDGAVVVRRAHQAQSSEPAQVTIPLNDRFARLVFLQTSVGKPRRMKHAGDGTFFPHESSELIGVYDVAFHDGLVLPVEIRAKENVGAWDAGIDGILYHARNIEAGTLPGGGPLLIWGNEWTNPRPDEPITEIRFRGAGGASDAQPILLGITTIEKDRLTDYRR